jgi:hypothetical protein
MVAEVTPSSWEDRERSISVNLGEALHNTGLIEEAIKARLLDPYLAPKAKAGLRQILRTTHRLQQTLKRS